MPGEGSLCSRGDGRKAYRAGLCQRCYRAAPHAPRAAPGEGARLDPVRLPASWERAITTAAEHQGVTVPAWCREAFRAALLLQALQDSELRSLVQNALEPS